MPTRPLHPSDLPALREFATLAEAEGFRFVNRLVDALIADELDLDGSREFFLARVIGDRLVAVGGVTPDPYLDDARTGRLRHLYVHPDARDGGVGTELVIHLERRATGSYDSLRLRTDSARAARFYARLGYRPVQSDSATHARRLPVPPAASKQT